MTLTKSLTRLMAIVLIASVCISCATVSRHNTFKTSTTTNQIKMADLEFLGETEVSVVYRTLFGVFRHIDTVNGQEYDPSDKSYTGLGTSFIDAAYYGPLRKAYGKVLADYPDASYFQVVRVSKKSDRLFLGTDSEVKGVVRAYRFRKDIVPCCNCGCEGGNQTPCSTLEEIIALIDAGESVGGMTVCAIGSVNFDTGKSLIKPESYAYMDKVAEVLIRTNARIDVKGHTDNIGGSDFNMDLSKERAKAVMEYLINKGAKRSQITYSYYGETRPIASNDTEDGRLRNRRVEFEFLK